MMVNTYRSKEIHLYSLNMLQFHFFLLLNMLVTALFLFLQEVAVGTPNTQGNTYHSCSSH
jgi:hypothetical protein